MKRKTKKSRTPMNYKKKLVVQKVPSKYGKLGDSGIEKNQDGLVMHTKTTEQINNMWNRFLEIEEPHFKELMGYGKSEIETIGVEKFINFMDWNTEQDTSRWRTDKLHVIPCTHCKAEFTTFELDFGLCPKCSKQYNMKKFYSLFSNASGYSVMELSSAFVYNEEFRKQFLNN